MSKPERFTNASGAPVPDNTNILTAGRRGPALLQEISLIEKLAHFDREVIPERRTSVLNSERRPRLASSPDPDWPLWHGRTNQRIRRRVSTRRHEMSAI